MYRKKYQVRICKNCGKSYGLHHVNDQCRPRGYLEYKLKIAYGGTYFEEMSSNDPNAAFKSKIRKKV